MRLLTNVSIALFGSSAAFDTIEHTIVINKGAIDEVVLGIAFSRLVLASKVRLRLFHFQINVHLVHIHLNLQPVESLVTCSDSIAVSDLRIHARSKIKYRFSWIS